MDQFKFQFSEFQCYQRGSKTYYYYECISLEALFQWARFRLICIWHTECRFKTAYLSALNWCLSHVHRTQKKFLLLIYRFYRFGQFGKQIFAVNTCSIWLFVYYFFCLWNFHWYNRRLKHRNIGWWIEYCLVNVSVDILHELPVLDTVKLFGNLIGMVWAWIKSLLWNVEYALICICNCTQRTVTSLTYSSHEYFTWNYEILWTLCAVQSKQLASLNIYVKWTTKTVHP